MKKLISILLFLVILSLTVLGGSCVYAMKDSRDGGFTVLLTGLDGDLNADSIVLAHFDERQNRLAFLQIPRDTYFSSATGKRINSIVPAAIARGVSEEDALSELSLCISKNFGIQIDTFISYTMKTFSDVIDAIGGIDLKLPQPVKLRSGEKVLSLDKGLNHINGEQSLIFVRSRNEYATADVGRIDAQKLFLASFINKIKNETSLIDLVKACIKTSDGWTLGGKLGDVFKMITKNKGRIGNISTVYATIPGKALSDNRGIWYYAISKRGAIDILDRLRFDSVSDFDPDTQFLNCGEEAFIGIYNTAEIDYTIFDDGSLSEIDLGSR